MAVVRPFRGCRYDPPVAGALADLLCPPYDMIGPALKDALQSLSPHNAVHLEGGEQPDPVNPEAGYQQAAALFRQWLEAGVLRQEDTPCFYLMCHTYQDRGRDSGETRGSWGCSATCWPRNMAVVRCCPTSSPGSRQCWTG